MGDRYMFSVEMNGPLAKKMNAICKRDGIDLDTVFVRAINALDPWQPIETAPRDGTRVVLWWHHWSGLPEMGWYKDNKWNSRAALDGGYEGDPDGPQAWMPLPPTPEGAV